MWHKVRARPGAFEGTQPGGYLSQFETGLFTHTWDFQVRLNLRAVQLLLGHTKMDSTVRYLGVELEDALAIAEAVEI